MSTKIQISGTKTLALEMLRFVARQLLGEDFRMTQINIDSPILVDGSERREIGIEGYLLAGRNNEIPFTGLMSLRKVDSRWEPTKARLIVDGVGMIQAKCRFDESAGFLVEE